LFHIVEQDPAVDAIENFIGFARTFRFEELPAAARERTRLSILDTLAATIAGARGDAVPELVALVAEWGGAPQATVLAGGKKLPLPLAALVNGVAGRAWDLDDVHEQNTCHITVNMVAPVLALAEARGPVDGREFMTAVAVGSEIICRLSAAPRISFSTTGSSMSYQCGFLGAALASARLLGLSPDATNHAAGIAYARLAGNQQGYVDGAMTVRLMQGVACEGGLIAALMAERGLTGSRAVLEGKFGYYPIYHRGQYEPRDLVDGLGTAWRIEEVSIKPVYPCCKYTHGPIEATVAALSGLGATADDVERIDVVVNNREVYDLVCVSEERKWNPQSVVDAQFSLPYAIAHAAVRRKVSLETFQPEALADARVRALMPRVKARLDVAGQGDGRGTFPMPGDITVTLKSGATRHERVTYIKGHPKNAMTFDDVAAKFRDCASFGGLPDDRAERVIDAVAKLETLTDSGSIARLAATAA
jgi:2-methylcitrate dehydratase PrpD